MTNAAQVGDGVTLADGWYRVCYGGLSTYSFVIFGCIDHGSGLRVADLLNKGYTFEPVVMLTQAEYDALTTERDQLRQEVANLKRMLEDLTPGGSEFHNSPARCIEFIKGKLAMEGKLMRALAKERQRINRQEAEKRELLSIVNSLGLPIEDIEVETMSLAEYEERYGGHHR